MAIFHAAAQTATDADKIVRDVDNMVDAAFVLLDTLDRIADEGPQILRTIRNLVQSLITMVDNGVSAMRNNPLAKGPWKIVMVLGAGILSGVGLLLAGIKRAITLLIELLQSRAVKKLRKVIDDVRNKISEYVQLSSTVKLYLGYVIQIATILGKQQDLLQKRYPGLEPLLRDDHLKEIQETVAEMQRVIGTLNAQVVAIQAKVAELERLRNDVNALVSAAAAVTTVINNILGFFANVFQRIKDFIASIPFIGWVEEKLGEAIDWAMEKLGIKAAIERMGMAARNLPFIKTVLDFMEDVARRVDALVVEAEGLMKHVVDEIRNNETVNGVVTTILGIFAGLDLRKVLKFVLPEWALELAAKAGELIKSLEAPEPTLEERIAEWAKEIGRLLTLHYLVPELPIRGDLQPGLDTACGRLAERLAARPPLHSEGAHAAVPVLLEWLSATSKELTGVAAIYNEALAETPELGGSYYRAGWALLRNPPPGLAPVAPALAMELIAGRMDALAPVEPGAVDSAP